VNGALALAASAAAALAVAADPSAPIAFSSLSPGELKPPWRALNIAKVKPAEIALVADEGATVLRVRAAAASGSAGYAVDASARGLSLAWRWKIDRVVEGADLAQKSGDDFAARVYVFFDVPPGDLPFGTRFKLKLLEILYGERLPTAAICYVWDNRHPIGTSRWNPYSERVRTVVLRSGNAEAGHWMAERRDLEADFREAFAAAAPRVSGIAAGNDTDQTGETVTAWFGDFRLEPRR